ncbi:hedgehog signaling/DD-peptidase zinc-binding domain-containing protein [Chytridium lagenaria]|nr:hedgehog signaling/DD-peptidase zinc-binding domain-containing protein [Chytridium lagenaria]
MIGGKAVQITNDCLKVKEAQVEVAKSAIVGPGIVGPKIVGPKINCGFRNLLPCGDNKECVMAQSEASANVAAPARPAPANAAANVLLVRINRRVFATFSKYSTAARRFKMGSVLVGRVVPSNKASSDGINIRINSGFRTNAKQAELFSCFQTKACNNGNLAARPGFSNHQNGIALDINVVDNAVFRWLSDNAAKFGFVRTVTSEPHHWELRPGSRCNAFVQFSCKSA